MIRRALIAAVVFVLAVPAVAADEPGLWAAAGFFGAAAAADIWTTERGLDHPGFREANPLLPDRPSDARLLVQSAVFGGLVWYASRDMWKQGQRKRVIAALVIAGLVHGAAARHNDRLWEQRDDR